MTDGTNYFKGPCSCGCGYGWSVQCDSRDWHCGCGAVHNCRLPVALEIQDAAPGAKKVALADPADDRFRLLEVDEVDE
jgi:hypothetical protein